MGACFFWEQMLLSLRAVNHAVNNQSATMVDDGHFYFGGFGAADFDSSGFDGDVDMVDFATVVDSPSRFVLPSPPRRLVSPSTEGDRDVDRDKDNVCFASSSISTQQTTTMTNMTSSTTILQREDLEKRDLLVCPASY